MRPRLRAPYVTRGPRDHLEHSGLSLALTHSSTLPGHLQDSPHHGCPLNGKCDSQGSLFSTWEETPVLPSSSTTQPPHPFSVAFLFIPLWNLTAPPLAPVHSKMARLFRSRGHWFRWLMRPQRRGPIHSNKKRRHWFLQWRWDCFPRWLVDLGGPGLLSQDPGLTDRITDSPSAAWTEGGYLLPLCIWNPHAHILHSSDPLALGLGSDG